MSNTPAFAEPAPDEPEADAAQAREERHLAMLRELAEIGMQMARAARDEALARAEAAASADSATPAPVARGADLGLVYSRIARAVRLTLALETRIATGIEAARVERRRQRVDVARRGFEQRQEAVRDFVAEAIEADAVERKMAPEAVEKLLDDLDERLEDGDYDDVLADAPIAELVGRICDDLGIDPDWRIWDDQAWAVEHLKACTPDDIGAERWAGLHPPPGHPGAAGPAHGLPLDPD